MILRPQGLRLRLKIRSVPHESFMRLAIAEARKAIDAGFDAALLDVNVGGQMVYDFAAELRRAGAPIVFLTGYHAGAIEPRFADAPVLTKPVERDDLAAALTRVFDRAGERVVG